MRPAGLTIGQLAAHAGVTVRAVRHYHRCGLLAEPGRDASGYRRYGADAVVDLIRIRALAGAGVPLARIHDLLAAGPEEFAAAVAEIDAALKRKIRDLTRHRRQIAQLTGGEALFLPPEVVGLLDQLRALGVSERGVRTERDGWILAAAISPGLTHEWAEQKLSSLADPEFRRIYLTCDQSLEWEPGDPRLETLADRIAAWSERTGHAERRQPPDLPPALTLMAAEVASASPGWRRLNELVRERLRGSRATGPVPDGEVERRSGGDAVRNPPHMPELRL